MTVVGFRPLDHGWSIEALGLGGLYMSNCQENVEISWGYIAESNFGCHLRCGALQLPQGRLMVEGPQVRVQTHKSQAFHGSLHPWTCAGKLVCALLAAGSSAAEFEPVHRSPTKMRLLSEHSGI